MGLIERVFKRESSKNLGPRVYSLYEFVSEYFKLVGPNDIPVLNAIIWERSDTHLVNEPSEVKVRGYYFFSATQKTDIHYIDLCETSLQDALFNACDVYNAANNFLEDGQLVRFYVFVNGFFQQTIKSRTSGRGSLIRTGDLRVPNAAL